MSQEKRYSDEHWDDLPLPDGDLAWQKMEFLLDNEKKRRVVPFWFWRYAGLGLLLIGISAGAWLWLGRSEENPTTSVQQKDAPLKEIIDVSKTSETSNPLEVSTMPGKKASPTSGGESPESLVPLQEPHPAKQENTTVNNSKPVGGKDWQKEQSQPSFIKRSADESVTPLSVNDPMEKESSPLKPGVPGLKENIVEPAITTPVPAKDSSSKKDSVATKAAEPVAGNEPTKEAKTKTGLFLTAGIGLQQAIAFGGQESSAYNYKGKQNSLSDRIPSVYLRLQQGAWFAQAEFQYAVPQPVKQVSFSQKTRYDVASQNLNTEQLTIRKLYYHQLPVSINYLVLPNWSIGTGAMYSALAGAVTEQEVISKNVQTGNEMVSRSIAPVQGYKDSFLFKSTAGILFQTDYHWKRLALGVRYTQNLQPFIQYTSPDGAVLNEKNRLLQAILRFRLF